jgi:hypothetical protein
MMAAVLDADCREQHGERAEVFGGPYEPGPGRIFGERT